MPPDVFHGQFTGATEILCLNTSTPASHPVNGIPGTDLGWSSTGLRVYVRVSVGPFEKSFAWAWIYPARLPRFETLLRPLVLVIIIRRPTWLRGKTISFISSSFAHITSRMLVLLYEKYGLTECLLEF